MGGDEKTAINANSDKQKGKRGVIMENGYGSKVRKRKNFRIPRTILLPAVL